MATDSPSQGPRRHFHRGRRGHDRRGGDRRGPQGQPPDQAPRGGDQPDVEQIMRDIRSRIGQRPGLELTDQQVQELAARRLESILDPRSLKPSLFDQLRRSAGMPADTVRAADRQEPPYTFDDNTLYASPSGFVRFMRKLLKPILKLLFDPDPLVRALRAQSRVNQDAARRETERDQRQAEWNALHYDILQRLAAEVTKVSLEMQSLALRVESLSAKVDFNERRVRGIEGAVHQPRAGGGLRDRDRERERDRDRERERDRDRETAQPAVTAGEPVAAVAASPGEPAAAAPGDAPRRRRRRRRGRRGGGSGLDAAAQPGAEPAGTEAEIEGDEPDDGGDAEMADAPDAAGAETAPERVTPQLETAAPDAREAAAPELPPASGPEPDRNEPQ